jgi:hypothetical protein
MRYLIPLLAACSGLTIAASVVPTEAIATEQVKAVTQVAAKLDAQSGSKTVGSTKTVCSRNHTLQVNPEGTKVAAIPEGLTWSSKIVQLFCRDVRINMIVVKDYCAVVRG